jgi:hypothetical protein
MEIYDYNKMSAQFMPILELIANHASIRAILNSRPAQALAAPKGIDKIGQGRILGIAQRVVAGTVRSRSQIQTRYAGLLRFSWLDAARSRVGVSSSNHGGLGFGFLSPPRRFHVYYLLPCRLL